MKSLVLVCSLSLSLGACAALDGNFMGGKRPASAELRPNASKEAAVSPRFEPMLSPPPTRAAEPVPELAVDEVWVPGYYEPVAGNWLWHQGQIRPRKDGHTLVPATYREVSGKVYFSAPSWRANAIDESKAK